MRLGGAPRCALGRGACDRQPGAATLMMCLRPAVALAAALAVAHAEPTVESLQAEVADLKAQLAKAKDTGSGMACTKFVLFTGLDTVMAGFGLIDSGVKLATTRTTAELLGAGASAACGAFDQVRSLAADAADQALAHPSVAPHVGEVRKTATEVFTQVVSTVNAAVVSACTTAMTTLDPAWATVAPSTSEAAVPVFWTIAALLVASLFSQMCACICGSAPRPAKKAASSGSGKTRSGKNRK